MSVKLIVLKSTEDVIADVSDIQIDGRIFGYKLKNPKVLTLSQVEGLYEEVDPTRVSINFSKWQPFSNDEEYQIPFDWVVTICDPLPNLKKSYEEHVNEERTVSTLSE